MENQQKTSNLDKSVEDILKFKEKLENGAENTEDVKSGKCTAEDEKQEPGYILYNAISESSIEILKQPTVVKFFENISKDIGEDFSKSLVELLAICMSHSAYTAITFYDQMLKGELTKQFDHYGDHLNAIGGTVKSHDAVLEVFSKRLSELEKKNKLDSVKTEVNK